MTLSVNLVQVLPIEIIHLILSFDGSIKYRKGKYTDQILKTDKRYDMLCNMPIPRINLTNRIQFDILIYFHNKNYIMYIGSCFGQGSDELQYTFSQRDKWIIPSDIYIRR